MLQEWSPVKRILSACEETPRNQDKNLLTPVSLFNRELFLKCAFVTHLGIADRSLLQIIPYKWLLLFIASMLKLVFACGATNGLFPTCGLPL